MNGHDDIRDIFVESKTSPSDSFFLAGLFVSYCCGHTSRKTDDEAEHKKRCKYQNHRIYAINADAFATSETSSVPVMSGDCFFIRADLWVIRIMIHIE